MGFQNSATGLELAFYAARSYSLMRPPRTGRRLTIAPGRREEQRFTGTGDLPNLYRTPAGAGWALAGDAGHHKDPSTGMGLSDAFLAAELLAQAIHDGHKTGETL